MGGWIDGEYYTDEEIEEMEAAADDMDRRIARVKQGIAELEDEIAERDREREENYA